MKVLIIYLTLLFAAIPTFSQKNTQKSYGSKDFDIKGSKSSEELLERIQNIRNISKEQLLISIKNRRFDKLSYNLLTDELKNDYEIAGEMIRKYPRSFSILTDSMKSNKSIIDYIEKDFAIYLFYSPQLTTNKNFLENYLEYDPLDYLSLFMANSDLLNNKELIMKIVNKISDKESLLIMAKCSSNLKKDKEFVKKMMYKNKYTVILSELEWWKDDNLVNQFINFKEPGIE